MRRQKPHTISHNDANTLQKRSQDNRAKLEKKANKPERLDKIQPRPNSLLTQHGNAFANTLKRNFHPSAFHAVARLLIFRKERMDNACTMYKRIYVRTPKHTYKLGFLHHW